MNEENEKLSSKHSRLRKEVRNLKVERGKQDKDVHELMRQEKSREGMITLLRSQLQEKKAAPRKPPPRRGVPPIQMRKPKGKKPKLPITRVKKPKLPISRGKKPKLPISRGKKPKPLGRRRKK